MDNSHQHLLDELAGLEAVCDQEFARCYPSLVAAIERDFRQEEELMDEVGLASFQTHLEQHARMLSALHHVAPHVQEGDVDPGREAIVLLRTWLTVHIDIMDKALADAVRIVFNTDPAAVPVVCASAQGKDNNEEEILMTREADRSAMRRSKQI